MTNEEKQNALSEIEDSIYHDENDDFYGGCILSLDGLNVIISKETVETIRSALTDAPKVDVDGIKRDATVWYDKKFGKGTIMPSDRQVMWEYIDYIATHYELVKKETTNARHNDVRPD